MTTFPRATAVLEAGVSARVFPGAVVEIGRRSGPIGTVARGALTYDHGGSAVTPETVYDLASLTKVLATAALIAQAIESGRMRLNDRVRHFIPAWTGDDRQSVTLRDLLEHCSGLPAHRRYWETRTGRASFELAICEEPLEYMPRTRAVYSDPGFMLLGFALESAAGIPLDRQFAEWRDRELGPNVELTFRPPANWHERTAPTEDSPAAEERRGVAGGHVPAVHDENCAALDGVAGHAGLFGTAAAVGGCARWWLAATALPQFARKSETPGSSRALAWDTMLTTSSCGVRLSPQAIGHTGFTGTSLWIDPAKDRYVAFVSNRVHPTREGEGIQAARRSLHDAVIADLEA